MTTKKARLVSVTKGMITRSGHKKCNLCLKGINESEKIVTKSSSSRTLSFATKWYHEECARRVNII